MSDLQRSDIKNMLLAHLYDRVRKGKGDKDASGSTIRRAAGIGDEFSRHYVEVLLESLTDQGYVRETGRDRYAITEAGIDLIESGWTFSEAGNQIVDAWDKPDGDRAMSVNAIATVQGYLRQCIILIDASNFSQEDKAQIVGLIRICEQLVDLPTPKLGMLKRILGWLKEVKELIPLVEAILKLVGKA